MLLLAGCQGPATPIVARAKVEVSAPVDGAVRVRGAAGAVMVPGATTVTISIFREAPGPRTLFHVGVGQAAVDSTYGLVDAQSGFDGEPLGTIERPVFSGDEVAITPYKGLVPIGYTIYLYVP